MPPRASWKGQLRLSLVAFPVRLHNAISSTSKISLNQLHADCHHRLKQQLTCPEHGDVGRSEIVKGYEYEKGKYVVIEQTDLEKIKLESDKTLELIQFIDADSLDARYLNAPYYVAPDGPLAAQAFRVVREAMKQHGKIGIGRVVLTGREHVFALEAEDRGFRLTTLRYASEVRDAAPYFEDIQNGDVPAEHLTLAEQLIADMSSDLDLSQFSDRYQESLLALINAKIEGSEPIVAQEAEIGKVINLMDALKKSVAKSTSRKKPAAKSVRKTTAKKKKAKRA